MALPPTTTPPPADGSTTDRPRSRRRRVEAAVVVALVALVAVAGVLAATTQGSNHSSKFSSIGSAIGGGGGESVAQVPRTALAPAVPPTTAKVSTGAVAQDSATEPAPPTTASSLTAGHSFVSTATMTVEADDLSAVKAQAISAVESRAGGLFGEESTFDGTARSTLTFKVPTPAFRSVLSELEGLGRLTSQKVATDDVTDQVIDLEARISAASTSLDRTRALLDAASTPGEITALDGEVSRRQADLEKLKGQQRTLADRTDLATVVLTIVRPGTPVSTSVPPAARGAGTPGFGEGIDAGWAAFTESGSIALAVVGAVLPFLTVVGPSLLLAWLVVRRRARRAAAMPTV